MQDKILAMYIRLSIEDGDIDTLKSPEDYCCDVEHAIRKMESNSISHQRMLLRDYIQRHPDLADYNIEEFCDDGFSGTNFDRPAFQNMMAFVKTKKVACILVKDLSRFGRNYLDVSSYLELILPVFGTRFISVNDNFDSNDYIGTTGGMELAFRNLLNGMYSRDISTKVKSALRTRNGKGEYTGGNPFYGYIKDPKDKHHLIVDEEVRPVVEKIFTMCMDGKSLMDISKCLNEEEILCPSEYKKTKGMSYNKPTVEAKTVWASATVRQIIKDERYTGKMVSNVYSSICVGKNQVIKNDRSDWIVVEGTHEGIISPEFFEKANQALSSRMRVRNTNTNSRNASNLFVCGCCGRKLRKTNGKQTYLYCLKAQYKDDTPCANIYEEVGQLQNCVLESIRVMGRSLAENIEILKRNEDVCLGTAETQIRDLNQKISRIKSQKGELYERYRLGHMSREQFLKKQMENSETIEAYEAELESRTKQLKKKRQQYEDAQKVRTELRTLDGLQEYDPVAIGKLVERIRVFPGGRIELDMKNADSIREILSQTGEATSA